jgi:hypothetical protein
LERRQGREGKTGELHGREQTGECPRVAT